MKKKCILIDGYSLVYRLFFGIRPMTSPKGIPTNVLYGYANVLYKIENDFKPDYFAVAFDLATPTFRHKVYADYKAGRDKMPEDLQVQVELLKELLEKMQIPMLSLDGYEADDVIGTFSRKAAEQGVKTQIMTGDRDSYQLVNDSVEILYTATRSGDQFATVDEAAIREKYGLDPKALIQVKALMGDPSDHIPGIKGIGEKTALKLIQKYQDLETLYAHLDDLKGKQKEKIENGKKDAFDSRFLGEICLDVPLDVSLDSLARKPFFNEESIAMLQTLGMKALLLKLETPAEKQESFESIAYITASSQKEIDRLLNKVNQSQKVTLVAYEEETLLKMAAFVDGLYYFLPDTASVQSLIQGLGDIANADSIAIVGHQLKKMTHLFHRFGTELVDYGFDAYIAAYLLDPSTRHYEISRLAELYLDQRIQDEEMLLGKGKSKKSLETLSIKEQGAFLVAECQVVHQLEPVLKEKLEATHMAHLMDDIELPLLRVMASMESEGIKIDIEALKALSTQFEATLKTLTQEIYTLSGNDSFNINSTKQLGVVLFEELQLPVIKKTKTGYSTNVDVLEQLRLMHPVVEKILEYRTISKLDSTYGKGLIKLIDKETHRIYTTFNQTVAATGRLSSSDPNLQNIPVRTKMGREIRRVFVPSDADHVLVNADYSQIELRVLAHLSGDENLIDAFKRNQDIHTRTASEIFSVPMDEVTKEARTRAKAINFGLIYGKQAFSLGKELGISRNEAQDYINRYFDRYPKVREYMEENIQSAHDKGYVTTLWERRRYLPDIHSRNKTLQKAAERMALNTPIQGTAADIIKLAMIKVYHRLEAEGLKSKLILQIHDELIIDTFKSEKAAVMTLIKEEMENAVQLDVPLTVDANEGTSWYALK